jgi:alkylation response protein AidB-like acyl-CoA dehydrogenase
MRDCRINLIFEGSSEVMHLFMAREAVDKHLQVAGAMIDPKNGTKEKLAAMPQILAYYATWYPPLWLRGLKTVTSYTDWGPLATHLRFIDRSCRKLARESFHGMAMYQAKMERKQGFLFRCVDVVMELFAMTATVSQARRMRDDGHPEAKQATELADLFCRMSRRRVKQSFRNLWRNDDAKLNQVAASVMRGQHAWLEQGTIGLGFTQESFKTRRISDLRKGESAEKFAAAS